MLTEALKKRKEGVILFDEIEKADWKVHNLLLQLLDEGFITDNKGNRVSCAECVIILTSNLGVRQVQETVNRGLRLRQPPWSTGEPRAGDHGRERIPPELVNRLDEVVVFNAGTRDVETICGLMLPRSPATQARRVLLQFDPKVRKHLTQEGTAPRTAPATCAGRWKRVETPCRPGSGRTLQEGDRSASASEGRSLPSQKRRKSFHRERKDARECLKQKPRSLLAGF